MLTQFSSDLSVINLNTQLTSSNDEIFSKLGITIACFKYSFHYKTAKENRAKHKF